MCPRAQASLGQRGIGATSIGARIRDHKANPDGFCARECGRRTEIVGGSVKAKTFMLIAGEVSGDLLAAELVQALRSEITASKAVPTWDYQPLHTSLEPKFFGAGGPRMKAAGVELAFDMTEHSLIGLSDAIRQYPKFRRFFKQLYDLALERQPDAIVCIDFSGFNSRFAHAIRTFTRSHSDWFHDWQPWLIQYVS